MKKVACHPRLLPEAPSPDEAFGDHVAQSFPNAEHYARCNFGIPFSPYITEEEQDEVVSAVLAAL